MLGMLPIIFGIYLREARGDSWCKVLNMALESMMEGINNETYYALKFVSSHTWRENI
jgi:hypothetical protein